MQTETVAVRLIVAADGALRTLDQFDSHMTRASQTTGKTGAAVDAMTRQLERMRKAQEAGVPVLKARAAVMSAEERALNSVLGKADAVAKARIAAERDMSRAVAAASNLVVQGRLAEEQAVRQLMQIEAAHAASVDRAVAGAGRLVAANQNVANSYQRVRAGANVNAANIGYQFQDIGVTAAMGMNPLMIGLQQGTQLTQSFQGQTLRQSIAGVGTALAGLASPISIATIGLTALSAVGIQWAMSMMQETDDATSALERHAEMLDKLLGGYGDLRSVADQAAEAILKLPAGVVASDLQASLEAQESTLVRIGERADAMREKFARAVQIAGVTPDISRDVVNQLAALRDLQLSAESTKVELDAASTAARSLYNTADDPVVREWANDFYGLTNELRNVLAVTGSLDAALRALPRDIQIRVSMQEMFGDAMGQMSSLYMDPRSQFDLARAKLREQADAAMSSAQSYSQAVGAATEYQRVLESINAAEAKALERATGRGGGAESPAVKWGGNVLQFKQRIEAQQLELALIGQSTYEIQRQRAAMDLLNQAKAAGLSVTPALTTEIGAMAGSYASATVELERMTQAANDNEAIWSRAQDGVSSVLKTWMRGGDVLDTISDKLLGIGDLLIDMAVRNLFQNALGGGMGGGMGMGRGGLLGGMIIPGILHQGGTAGADGYGHGKAYSSALWANAPRYHNGGTAGLKPDEVPAILQRGERIIPRNAANDNGAVDRSVVEVRLGPGLEASILQRAGRQAVQITDQAVRPIYGVMERSSGRYQ